jgi:hypothetical protein
MEERPRGHMGTIPNNYSMILIKVRVLIMKQAAVRSIPRYKFGTAIDLDTLLGALFVATVMVGLFVAWYYRDALFLRLKLMRTDDLVGEMLREARNGTNYGWAA